MGGLPSANHRSTIMYDPVTDSYDETLPSLNYDREYFVCTLFYSQHHGGRPVVLVAGGDDQSTAELYDFTTANAAWTPSKISFAYLTCA